MGPSSSRTPAALFNGLSRNISPPPHAWPKQGADAAVKGWVATSASEQVGQSTMRIDDRGGPEFDASAVDGDTPALLVDLLVVRRAQQATT